MESLTETYMNVRKKKEGGGDKKQEERKEVRGENVEEWCRQMIIKTIKKSDNI